VTAIVQCEPQIIARWNTYTPSLFLTSLFFEHNGGYCLYGTFLYLISVVLLP
jgi:hypothetical protein